jgi:hypothetical protein
MVWTLERRATKGACQRAGCGKTTTVSDPSRAAHPPDRAQIRFKDRDVLKMSGSELQRLRGSGASMIFQDPTAALNPVFTIGQQMEAGIQSSAGQKNLSHAEVHQRAVQSLQEVALADPERLLAVIRFSSAAVWTEGVYRHGAVDPTGLRSPTSRARHRCNNSGSGVRLLGRWWKKNTSVILSPIPGHR